MMDGDALVGIALESGAADAAVVDTAAIRFHEDFRKACEKNFCRRYDTSWMGPPAIGPIRELAQQALRLESGLIMLAIAVSGAPFLGLLGTVWGVMNAFGGIAQAAASGGRPDLTAMAPGVSGALVTTVAGLLVAIPSMFGYNWLVHNLRVLTVELDNFAQHLVSNMETEYLSDNDVR